ncbi:DUF5372 family protein [Micromonospora sp. ATA51]|uniref:DUF5372 family protein n=1 Tax=Micromonospora sp. ATA51 TaxID=2806098 RepID=UPI0035CC1FBF
MTITHPFHPLAGQRVTVLFTARRGGVRMLTCRSGSRQVTVAESWTDHGPEPQQQRLSVEGLQELLALVAALRQRRDVQQGADGEGEREIRSKGDSRGSTGRDGDGPGEHDHDGPGRRP